jgi:hypothetical protein
MVLVAESHRVEVVVDGDTAFKWLAALAEDEEDADD